MTKLILSIFLWPQTPVNNKCLCHCRFTPRTRSSLAFAGYSVCAHDIRASAQSGCNRKLVVCRQPTCAHCVLCIIDLLTHVGCDYMPSYPEMLYYHDCRDALFQLPYFLVANSETFDLCRYKVKINEPDQRYVVDLICFVIGLISINMGFPSWFENNYTKND